MKFDEKKINEEGWGHVVAGLAIIISVRIYENISYYHIISYNTKECLRLSLRIGLYSYFIS